MAFLYIILLIASFLFYILYVGPISFYLFSFLLVLPIVTTIILIISKNNIRVSFQTLNMTCSKGNSLPVIVTISNDSIFPVANAVITFEYSNEMLNKTNPVKISTPVYPKNTQSLRIGISSEHYGTVKIKITKVKIYDMLRLFSFKLRGVNIGESQTSMTFIPDFIQIDNDIANYSDMGLDTDTFSKNKKGDDPSEIFDLHEYNEGDRISRIHWKLTAKLGKTFIKDYSLPVTNSITIAANMYIDELGEPALNSYDCVVEAVSALTGYLYNSECPHTVLWADGNNVNRSYNITDEDSSVILVKNLLRSVMPKTNHMTLTNYISSISESAKCGHFIYVTTDIDENTISTMLENNIAVKYTILLADSNRSVQVQYKTNNFEIIRIKQGCIPECIQDLRL